MRVDVKIILLIYNAYAFLSTTSSTGRDILYSSQTLNGL